VKREIGLPRARL